MLYCIYVWYKKGGFGTITLLFWVIAAFLAAVILIVIAPQPLKQQQTKEVSMGDQNILPVLLQDMQKTQQEAALEVYPSDSYENPSLLEIKNLESDAHTEPLQENVTAAEFILPKSEVGMSDTTIISPSLAPLIPIPELNERVRPAVVNILCTSKTGGLFKPVSGSGVIIDPHGVIITNAHLAQYFLLTNYQTENFLECIVREGSPAEPRYRAELLYISPEWIQAHEHEIKLQSTKGTGEHDFAFLRIAGTIDPTASLPESFPFIELEVGNEEEIALDDAALAVSYPAELLGGIAIQKNLALISTISNISDLFTFGNDGNTLDVIGVSGSIVSQKGSSGGAIVRQKSGQLTGLIALNSSGETTDDRALRALTLSYVSRALEKATGSDLKTFLDGDLAEKIASFNKTTAPGLTKLLEEAL